MAAFSPDVIFAEDPHDFAIARGGGLATYLSPDVLADSERELDALGYVRLRMDASEWRRESRLHDDFAKALDFPSYYGRNLDALIDCLRDVASGDYGWDVTRTGLAVTLHGVGVFARKDPVLARSVVDILARTSSEAMLFGHRILWLLHVDDARFRMAPVRELEIPWNDREWLDAHRG